MLQKYRHTSKYGHFTIGTIHSRQNSRPDRASERNPGLSHGFNLNSIKKSCREVCHTNITGIPSEPFDIIRKNIQCRALFKNPILDEASQYDEPPQGNIDWVHHTYRLHVLFLSFFDNVNVYLNHFITKMMASF